MSDIQRRTVSWWEPVAVAVATASASAAERGAPARVSRTSDDGHLLKTAAEELQGLLMPHSAQTRVYHLKPNG